MSSAGSPYDVRDRLGHVYWIGGSPCSGKSSIVTWLAERIALRPYICDDRMWPHVERATPEVQPHMHRVPTMSWEEIWMRPVDVLLADEIAFYREEWPMIVAELTGLPVDRPVIAEGAALLPALVHSVLAEPRRAVWLVPTEPFQIAHYSQRRAVIDWALDGCTDPEQAFRNWMARDAAMGRWISAETARLGLSLLTVDGACTLEESAVTVAAPLGLDVRRNG